MLRTLNESILEFYSDEEISGSTLRNDIKLFANIENSPNVSLPEGQRTYTYSDTNFNIAQNAL